MISNENSCNWKEIIEHKTGKKIKEWRQLQERYETLIVFTDNTCCYLAAGETLENMVFKPLPKSICVSCGKESHCGKIDELERCEVTLKNFWEKARRLYWHRYSKNKNK